MSFIGKAFGALTGAKAAAKGAQQAANIQASAADRAIAEQRGARDQATALQQPYVDAGARSLAQQMSLLGLNGTAGQQESINALLASPEYTTSLQQGEEAILQNASATGGLRGGNTQNSLSRFRGDLLQQVFNSQYARLSGVTSMGQNAAAGVGNVNLSTASNIGDLLGQQGAALAGGAIAKGNVAQQGFNNAIQIASAVAGFTSPKKPIAAPGVSGF